MNTQRLEESVTEHVRKSLRDQVLEVKELIGKRSQRMMPIG